MSDEHKLPPQDLEAEMSILGGLFLEPDCWPEVAASITVEDFFRNPHRLIFASISHLAGAGAPVDLVSVTSQLRDAGRLEAAGGTAYIMQLLDYTPTAANIGYHCRLVRKKAVARRVIVAAREIGELAYKGEDTDSMMASALAALEKAGQGGSGSDKALLTLTQMADLYENHVKNLEKARFVTGFSALDGVIRGVAPGEVMMITAYSGLFKSALLQNMLLEACRRTREHHLFFSLEMPATRVFERTVQIALEEYTYRVESGFHHHEGYRTKAMADLAGQGADKLICCQEAALTIEQIEHYARLARARFGNLGAIGIDYLGLMGASGTKTEYERISYVAENSKHLAKRLNVPVIILGQINRNAAREGELEKHSAKGSGAVEASADYMLGLTKNDRKELLLKILKNRNGEENVTYRVEIDAKYLKFRSLEPYDDLARKNTERGQSRIRQAYKEEPVSYDPFP
jgi:replicative DNA helicase